MFTGIIEEIGHVTTIQKMADGFRLGMSAKKILEDLKVDDSISIDGACQTVIERDENHFMVEAVGETLQKTTLGNFRVGQLVNLERSLTLESRLGGHLVQGHINGIGIVTQWKQRGENFYLEVELKNEIMKYCILEGSIAVNGISLTIANLKKNLVGISIIPHTVKHTTLHNTKAGDKVNIEVDLIAKYVERLLNTTQNNGLTIDKLKSWGY